MVADLRSSQFENDLRRALQHLYDPDELKTSPLVALFGFNPKTGGVPLRQLLLDAIEALKPSAGVAAEGRTWRTYWELFHRYVGQFSRAEVANNMGLSVRQVVREDKRAIQNLAAYLWGRYNLGNATSKASQPVTDLHPASPGPSREAELDWLVRSQSREMISLSAVLTTALELLKPLLSQQRVRVVVSTLDEIMMLAPPGTLRQALVDVLTAAVCAVPGGSVDVTVGAGAPRKTVTFRAHAVVPALAQTERSCLENIAMAHQLLGMIGGELAAEASADPAEPFTATVTLEAIGQIPVLVVDDNADTLQLFERYLSGSQYLFSGARDALQGLELAEKLKPRVVVIDVMMPRVEGWDLLQRLRVHVALRDTPVIICSILPEEQLALAMGASAYLRKPVSQADFLDALNHELDRPPQ
ncbi:MAG: response regulator [Chloroflexi bacterium]|nr:response regulator [Chloroflexota bacterium]